MAMGAHDESTAQAAIVAAAGRDVPRSGGSAEMRSGLLLAQKFNHE
jgi:hypothetical protein